MKLPIAILVFCCVATVAGCTAGILLGRLGPAVALGALGLGVVAGVCAWREACPERGPRWGVFDWLAATAFGLFALRAFCWLIYWSGGGISYSSPYNLGDLSLHLTLVNNFAAGVPLWPANPIFPSEPLRYPAGMDLFNALLLLAGIDLFKGLIWAGLVASLATFLLLRRWGGPFAVAGFLFNGGIAGFAFLSEWTWYDYQADLAWKSIPLTMFVTQRGLLYAIPAGLALLWSWRNRFPDGGAGRGRPLPFWIEFLLYATMPLFHLHSFVFFSALLGVWVLFAEKPVRRHALFLGFASLFPAGALTFMIAGSGGGSLIGWKPGWLQYPDRPVWFWWYNFGVLPVVVVAACAVAARNLRRDRMPALFVLPSVAVFGVTCFVMLAPWEWDNTKVMIWSYLAVLPFLWRDVLLPAPAWFRAAACGLLFFSGMISLAGGLGPQHINYKLASRAEVDGVAKATKGLPATAVYACVPIYNHPVLLTGHKAVLGYTGHLWTHGYKYAPKEELLGILMRGEDGWAEAAKALEVRFVFWGEREAETYKDSARPWRESARLVATGPWGELYDLDGI